ncbi:MAG: bifunctional riboflavin kinase/FAD synthetase [Bacteroidota bacterium]
MEIFHLHYPELTFQGDLPAERSVAEGPSVVAIGVFDGVHKGHRAVLDLAIETARRSNLVPTVLTFIDHPQNTLRPDLPVPLLTPWLEKQQRLAETGVRRTVGVRFTRAFAELSPWDFTQRILVEQLGARAVVVGPDFAFGHQQKGHIERLLEFGKRLGFELKVAPPFSHDGVVSSTRIRRLLATGALEEAEALLGYRYCLRGTVVGGDQRGRLLGFPTANLKLPEQKLVPAYGVYAGWAVSREWRKPAVINVGQRPTFDPPQLKIEAHVLDWEGDLYGQELSVELVRRLRPEQAFPNVEALKSQMREDSRIARAYF